MGLLERLSKLDLTRRSAVLEQRLAELYADNGKTAASIDALERALKLKPAPPMRTQLQLGLARRLAAVHRNAEAVRHYDDLIALETSRQARLALFEEALPVAQSAGAAATARRFETEIRLLKAAATNTSPINR